MKKTYDRGTQKSGHKCARFFAKMKRNSRMEKNCAWEAKIGGIPRKNRRRTLRHSHTETIGR